MYIYILIYIYIYTHIYNNSEAVGAPRLPGQLTCRRQIASELVRPISLLRLSLLRLLGSNFPGNSLRAWEFQSL